MSADKARQEGRQEMYKNYNRSPCWKEQFRRRCLERLKDRRDRYLSSIRSADNVLEADSDVDVKRETDSDKNGSTEKTAEENAHERIPYIDIIMKEEFDRLKGEVSLSKDTGSKTDYSLSGIHKKHCLNENELVSWYEEIYVQLRAELKETQEKEEKLSLQDACDEHLKHEEQELCSALEALCTEEVICPICAKFNLMEYKSVILCRCGLKIDVEQDCITLKYVKDALTAGADEHSQRCESKPTFSLNQKFGISNLLMSCQDCDFLFVII